MNLSAPFIRKPVATSLLALAVLVFGVAAYLRLPVALLPNTDFPTIRVTAQLPGASPETMASAVATPLERRFGRIAGITEITSTSAVGTTVILLQFGLSRDSDLAARDVQAAISAAGAELPANMPSRPFYRKVNPADIPTMFLSLTSDAVPHELVFEQANAVLAQKIAQVPGVSQVSVGGDAPAVRIQVDPVALAGNGLTLEDLRAALEQSTVNMPKGSLHGSEFAFAIDANDQLVGAKAFTSLVVATKGDATVRLSDVAEVVDESTNQRVAVQVDGKPAVVVYVSKQPEANLVEMNARIRALLPSLQASISSGIKVDVVFDRARIVGASVHYAEETLLFSVVLVILVVFVFLRTWRATVIASVALPLSLIGTFAVMYLLDYSLDTLSLMALTVSTGFVVDDAIVVTEKTTALVQRGVSRLEAAIVGAKQIGFTIVSITASLLAALIPVLLVGGIVGRLFREFAVVLSIAVTVSAVISLTLTPMMASKLLRPDSGREWIVGRALDRAFRVLLRGYERSLLWALSYRRLMQAVAILTVGATTWLYVVIPKSLFPRQDSGFVVGTAEAPQDVSFFTMQQREVKLDAISMKDPDVEHVLSFLGVSPSGPSPNTGTAYLVLRAKPPRVLSADEVVGRLRGKLAQVEGAQLHLQAAQDVRIGARTARTQYQYTLQGADLEELRTWAPRILDRLRKLPELKDVASDLQTSGLEYDVKIDRDTAARLGISAQAIDDVLYDAFGQRQVATSYTTQNFYRVVLEVKPDVARSGDGLDQLFVRSATGRLVPLAALTTRKSGTTPLTVSHQGQSPAVTISFNLAPNVSLGDAMTQIRAAERELGLPPSLHAAFQGTAQAFEASLATQPFLVLVAILAVYIVLGILYESFVHPLTILSTLPSATIGALIALIVFNAEFTVIAFVGVILLIGIVKKNAILMIDFALDAERNEGASPEVAIHRACVQRFRPITMTSLAALFGALPLALGAGTGAELRRPLGIAIVGGLLVSQVLTLYTTPVVYLALGRLTRSRRAVAHRDAAGGVLAS